MNESKLKAAAMDSVGELPAGYLHLPTTPIKQEPKSDAWNDAGTKPKKACFCETYHDWDDSKWVQFWNGKHWCAIGMSIHEATAKKNMKSHYQYPQWREVQP